jgi:hypothetical protein
MPGTVARRPLDRRPPVGNAHSKGGRTYEIDRTGSGVESGRGRGMVASSWILSDTGPAKRSYQLTPAGEHCLRKWILTLEEYRDGINSLLKVARKAAAGSVVQHPK